MFLILKLTQYTIDVTGIITKKNTTKCCKTAHEVGLPGDWSLDAVNIGCGRKLGNNTTTQASSPVRVEGLSNALAVGSGALNVYAISGS